MLSWSRYLDQLSDWYEKNTEVDWTKKVKHLMELIDKGEQVDQMMQVTGEEGVTIEDYIIFQKALFVDMVYLQQDAFDDVDATAPLERQKKVFKLVYGVAASNASFPDKDAVRKAFQQITGLLKNFHYLAEGTPEYQSTWDKLEKLCADDFRPLDSNLIAIWLCTTCSMPQPACIRLTSLDHRYPVITNLCPWLENKSPVGRLLPASARWTFAF